MPEENENIIEITDDDGKTIKCELYDIVEFEGKEYAILTEAEAGDEAELVLMRYCEEQDGSYFETIEDDEEFEKVSEYIESLDFDSEEE